MPRAEDSVLGQRGEQTEERFKEQRSNSRGGRRNTRRMASQRLEELPEGRSGSIEPEAPRRSSEKRTRK